MKDPVRTKRVFYAAQTMRRSLPKGFCAAPFTQLFVYPTGDVFVCCEGAGHLGNIKNKTLEELWNGPAARQLRQEFLSGNPMQCRKNIENKRCNEACDGLLPDTVPTEIQDATPVALDLIVDGTCNIDCIMCEVKNQRESLLDLPSFETEIARKVFPTVKQISVKSGEPFVQKATFELIKQVSQVNEACIWNFTTNGQYKFESRIREPLEKIRVGRITFSVDSVDSELFQLIRKRGSLARLERAMDAIQSWSRGKSQEFQIDFAVNVTLQKLNWRDVPNVLKYFGDRDVPSTILFVEKPLDCSLLTSTVDEVADVLEYYLRLPTEFEPYLMALYQGVVPLLRDFKDPLIRKLGTMIQMRGADYLMRRNQICPFPFTQISLFPNGSLKPCCWLDGYDLRERGDEGFSVTWNGGPIRALREQHLSGDQRICGEKMKRTGCHRTHSSLFSLFSPGELQGSSPLRLDWFFSGQCNLECRSCDNWQFSDEFPGADAAWESLKIDVLPYLCEIDLKGGEPFVQKRTFALMETMRSLNPLCVWSITTNGQIRLGDRIKELLSGLLIGSFSVSIDSLDPERFAFLRVKGVLEKTLAFLDELITYNEARPMGRRFEIVVNCVFQRENWREAEEFLLFGRRKNVAIYFVPLVNPKEPSVFSLPPGEFEEMRQYVNDLATKYPVKSLRDLRAVLY